MPTKRFTIAGALGIDTSAFRRDLNAAVEQGKRAGQELSRTLTRGAKDAARGMDAAGTAATNLGRSIPLDETRAFTRGLGDMREEIEAGLRPLRQHRDELKEHERALKQTLEAQDRTTAEYRETVAELVKVRRELRNTTTELRDTGTAWSQLGDRMTRTGARLSLGLTAPLTILGTVSVNAALGIEQFETALTTMLGSADRATALIKDLRDFAAKTPFEFTELQGAVRTLIAFGVESDNVVGTLRQLGDVAAGTGSNIADLAQIYGRTLTTGRADMQEINRLADRGIPVYSELADILNTTTGNVRALVSEGKIGFPEMQELFRRLTSEGGKFQGMMEEQSRTVSGRISNLKDTLAQLSLTIGETLLPVVAKLVDWAQRAADWIDSLDARTKQWIVTIGAGLAATGPVLVGLGSLARIIPTIVTATRALVTVLTALTGPAGLLALLGAGIAALVLHLTSGPDPLDAAIAKVNDALTAKDQPALVTALQEVIDKVDGPLKTALQGLRDDLVATGDTTETQTRRIAHLLAHQEEIIAAQRRVTEARAALADAIALEDTFTAAGRATTAAGDLVFDAARQTDLLAQRLNAMGEGWVMDFIRLNAAGQFEFTDRAIVEAGALNMAAIEAAMRELSQPIIEVARAVQDRSLTKERGEELAAALTHLNTLLTTPPPITTTPPPPATITAPPPPTTTAPPPPAGLTTTPRIYATRDALLGNRVRHLIAQALRDATPGIQAAITTWTGTLATAARAAIDALNTDTAAEVERFLQNADRRRDDLRTAADALTIAQQAADRDALNARLNQEHAIREAIRSAGEAAQTLATNAGAALTTALDRAFTDSPEEAARFTRTATRLTNALQERYDQAAYAAAVTVFSDRQRGVFGRGSAFAVRPATAALGQAFTDLSTALTNYKQGTGTLDDVTRAVEALTRITPLSVARIDELTDGVFTLAEEARRAALVQAFDEAPGLMPLGATPPVPRALTPPGVTAVIQPNASALPPGAAQQAMENEIKARQKLVDDLLKVSASDGPMQRFGKSLLNLAASKLPLLNSAIEGFVQGGPIGAAVAVFTELLARAEAFGDIMGMLDNILQPVVEMLNTLLTVLKPIVEVAINLVQAAFIPLGIIIEEVLAPVITAVAGAIVTIYNAIASAINAVLGWAGVNVPLIDLNGDAKGEQGIIAGLEAERADVLDKLTKATSEAEIADLNRRLAEIDAELARLRALGLEDPNARPDAPNAGTTPGDTTPSWTFTSTAPTIQFAVATPLVEAANMMLDAATTIRDAFDPAALTDNPMVGFTTALRDATPVLDRLATEGVLVNLNAPPAPVDTSSVGALR